LNRILASFIIGGIALMGCGSGTRTSIVPVRKDKPVVATAEPPEPKEPPPESFPARPFTAAPATWAELANGVKIVSRRDKAVPIAHLRIAVLAGSSVDGEMTGLSAVCARAVASSGAGALTDTELSGKLETLGATLKVDLDADRIVYGLSVVKDRLPEAFDLLAQVVTKPHLGKDDVIRVQKRLAEEAADNARGDGRWGAMMVLYRDLFELPSEHHPYASYDATADDINKIKPADCKTWHKKFFVPSNMLVAASGDVEPAVLQSAAKKGFGVLRKSPAPTVSFTDPVPPAAMKITLVDRPGSTQSEVAVGTLAPKKDESSYASFLVADQVVGGTYTGRLFTDVREKRGLAYISFSGTDSYANGPSVFYLYAQTQNSSTGEALTALLEHAQKMVAEAPTPLETETASRFLAGWNSIESGVPGRTADSLCNTWVHKQGDDAPDELAKAIRKATPESTQKAFAEYVRQGHAIVVVAGDAASVGPALQAFGEVKVVDPTRNFARIKTLPGTGR
jgi:zinc protease